MSQQPQCAVASYSARPARALPTISFDGWTLKPYRILGRTAPETGTLAADSLETLRAILPRPATTSKRPAMAFAIEHLATPLDYLVVCWWDNRNELITRIFVRGGDEPWRQSSTESFCVWDLDIIWFERNAFVKHMLAATPDLAAYAAARFDKAFAG